MSGDGGIYSFEKGVEVFVPRMFPNVAQSVIMRELGKNDIALFVAGFHPEVSVLHIKNGKKKQVMCGNTINGLENFDFILKKKWTTPFIHHLKFEKVENIVMSSLETGNVLVYKDVFFKKPFRCFEGHMHRVVHRFNQKRTFYK